MGDSRPHRPVLLIMAAFSRHEEAFVWTREHVEAGFGPIALCSDPMPFAETRFYEPSMGGDLLKILLACEQLIDPARLPQIKLQTNGWEAAYRQQSDWSEQRPLNVDPGYLTEAKLVLASTKDRDHRIYLDLGIYAEVTLYYQRRGWQAHAWTYPDYRSSAYHQFFTRCRDYLRQRYRELPT